jgi:DNA polymerase-4
LLAGSLNAHFAFLNGPAFSPEIRFPDTDCTLKLMRFLDHLWRERPEPRAPLLQVGVVLGRLLEKDNYTPELFQNEVANAMGDDKHQRLDAALDNLRNRFGRDVVYFGSVQDHRKSAPMRISFTHIPDPVLEGDSSKRT